MESTKPVEFTDWDIQSVRTLDQYQGFINFLNEVRTNHPDTAGKYSKSIQWAISMIAEQCENEVWHGQSIVDEYERRGIDIFAEYSHLFYV
jgi:hypothetical protein